jgi:hypothetical protein
MAEISNSIQAARDKYPNAAFHESLAYLINYCMKITASGALLAAVQAATGISDLRSGIEGLQTNKSGGDRWLKHLSNHLQYAYNKSQMDATDIAAFTTVNTASATTDLLYGLCTQHDSRLTSTWGEIEGCHFHPYVPSFP